jgi:hypothetical protein
MGEGISVSAANITLTSRDGNVVQTGPVDFSLPGQYQILSAHADRVTLTNKAGHVVYDGAPSKRATSLDVKAARVRLEFQGRVLYDGPVPRRYERKGNAIATDIEAQAASLQIAGTDGKILYSGPARASWSATVEHPATHPTQGLKKP